MVVQCPTCQTRFRLSDEKVTARGVRVRCTSCRNLFQVSKDGATSPADASSGTGPVAASRPPTGPVSARPPTGPVSARPPTGPVSARPPTGPQRIAPAEPHRARDADDLFGMAELTGEASPRSSSPAVPDFDSIPLDEPGDETGDEPGAALREERFGEPAAAPLQAPAPRPSEAVAPPAREPPGAALQTPFEGLPLGDETPPPAPVALEATPPKERRAAPPRKPPERPPLPSSRSVASAALTGLFGAGLAAALVLGLRERPGPLGGGGLVAAHLASGLYDTAGGQPVYFVRGRVENQSARVQGPARVVVELVGEAGEVRATAIAGAEPGPEEVHDLRGPADAEALARRLERPGIERRLEPGASLPFFALFPEPPPLGGTQLRVRVELADGWAPRGPRADRER